MKRSKEVKKVKATRKKSDSVRKVSNVDKKESITKQKQINDFFGSNKEEKISSVDSSLPDFPKNMPVSIYSWNVAGLRAVLKKDEFKVFIEKEKPDILCFNETKVDEEVIVKNNLNTILGGDYKAYFNCCKIKKGYSGTAIFTKYKPLSVNYGINKKKHDEEGRVITMEFEDFFLIATYIPNAGEGLKRLDYRVNDWDKDFQEYLIDLKTKKHIIWIGDTNVCHKEIDINNPKGNLKSAGFTIEERNSFSDFLSKGFVDTWRKRNPDVVKYSYWSNFGNARANNKGWRLDYAVVDEEADKYIVESEIHSEYKGSDHCPVKVIWHKKYI